MNKPLVKGLAAGVGISAALLFGVMGSITAVLYFAAQSIPEVVTLPRESKPAPAHEERVTPPNFIGQNQAQPTAPQQPREHERIMAFIHRGIDEAKREEQERIRAEAHVSFAAAAAHHEKERRLAEEAALSESMDEADRQERRERRRKRQQYPAPSSSQFSAERLAAAGMTEFATGMERGMERGRAPTDAVRERQATTTRVLELRQTGNSFTDQDGNRHRITKLPGEGNFRIGDDLEIRGNNAFDADGQGYRVRRDSMGRVFIEP